MSDLDLNAELDAVLASQVQGQVTPPLAPQAVPSPLLTEDQELDQVLAAQAPEPVEQPELPPEPRRVNMLDPSGNLVNVSEEFIPTAYEQGYRLDASELAPDARSVHLKEGDRVNTYAGNDPELQKRIQAGALVATPDEVETEYGDVGSQIAAGAEGVAQGVTMGGYGLAASALSDDYERERELREAYNPVTSTVGNVVGAVAPALLSGGAGAAGTVARLTPAGRLAALGTRLGETLTAKATQAGLGAAGRIAAIGAAAAAEGAVDNTIRTVADDLARGDVEITAERMLDSAWEGAKWGGLLGAGAGAIGEGVAAYGARRTAKALQAADELAAAENQLDDLAQADTGRPRAEIETDLEAAQQKVAEADALGDPQAVEQAEDAVQKLSMERDNAILRENGVRSDQDIDLTLKVEEQPEQAKGLWASLKSKFNKVRDARQLEQRFSDVQDELTGSVTNRLDDLQRLRQNDLDKYLNRSKKPRAIADMLEQEGVVWTPEQAANRIQRYDDTIKLLDDVIDGKSQQIYSQRQLREFTLARDAMKKAREHMTGLKGSGPISPDSRILRGDLDAIAGVYWAEDSFKSYLGQLASQRPGQLTTAEAELQRIYMKFRADLQDPNLWGKSLANFQTVTNAIESKAIPAGKIFNSKFGVGEGHLGEHAGEHGFDVLLEADPKKVEALLARLGDASSYKDERDFIGGLMRNLELVETKAKFYRMPDELVAKLGQARKTVEGIVEDVRAAKVLKMQRDQAVRLAKEHEGIDKVMMAMDALGAFIPGVHIVGKTVGTAANMAKLATSVEKLGSGAVKTEKAVESAAKATVKNFIKNAGEGASSSFKSGGGLGISGNALRKVVEQAQALQDPKSKESRNLSAQLQDVARESPELAQAIEQKVLGKAEFIASKVGPTMDTSDPFRTRPALMDPITERKVAQYVDAANNPGKALDRLAHGRGTMADVETLRTLYPRLYQSYVKKVVDRINEAKKPPTYAQRQRLYLATGVPMDRTQDPAYVAYLQSIQGEQPTPEDEGTMKPVVTPGRAKLEFKADQKYGNRSDELLARASE